MSIHPRRIAAAALLCTAWALPARGQDSITSLLGRPIAGVEIRIEGRVETAAPLLGLNDIKAGDRLSAESYRRVADRLNQLPRFEELKVLADVKPDGSVLLIFDLLPSHPINSLEIKFTAASDLTEADLDRLVRERFSGLPKLDRRAEIEDEVEAILKNEGYWSAKADATVTKLHDPDRATLTVTVTPGTRTRIASLDMKPAPLPAAVRILTRRGVTVGAPFRERDLQTALAEIRDELRSKRYYTAVADAQPPTFSADGEGVGLVLTIVAGPIVDLEVNKSDLPGSVDDLIPIKRQGSVDQDLLDEAVAAIEDGWRREGYRHARAAYSTIDKSADHRIITFTIDRGRRYRIARIDWPAGLKVTPKDVDELKALRIGAWFDQYGVVNALIGIRRLYQDLGYHRMVLNPEFEEKDGPAAGEGTIVIHPNITEGPKAIVRAITFDLGDRPVVTEAELRQLLESQERGPNVYIRVTRDREVLRAHYLQRGFLSRIATIDAAENEAGTEATLSVKVREGPQVLVGEIIVVGNEDVSRDVILSEITLRTGAPYSQAARTASDRALRSMGVFSSVNIEVDEPLPGETSVRVVVSVQEASSIHFEPGAGVEMGMRPRVAADGTSEDRIEFAPRASISVGRRNLGGKNRAVDAFARISFKRNAGLDDPTDTGFGFTEYLVRGSFTERRAFRSSTDLQFSVSSEQAVRTSFNFARQLGTADIFRALTPRLSLLGRYSLESTRLFDTAIDEAEQPLIDRLFPQVRLSVFSVGAVWDRRDNPLKPSSGSQINANLDLAFRPLGSEVGFAKSFVEASIYRRIPSPRLLILALRGQLGLARGFERTVPVLDSNGQPVLDGSGNPVVQVVADLPASRRFFAGGSGSVRGFQSDRLGVREILNDAGLSNGGNGLVVFNAELRGLVGKLFKRDLTVVGFVDSGNVFNRLSDVDLSRLRTTVGFGFRYQSPLGPLRLDFGFKTDRMTFPNTRERRWEIHLSIGEVF